MNVFGFGFWKVGGQRAISHLYTYSFPPSRLLIGPKEKDVFPDFGRKEEGRKRRLDGKRDEEDGELITWRQRSKRAKKGWR
jgi:hypothetical protein